MWEIIRKNQQKSMLLLILMGVVLVLLGYVIGTAVDPEGGFAGIIIAFVLYFILLIVAFSSGKKIMLRMNNAHKIGPDDYPQLYNIVEEMRLAA
ncbi:MAG: hypothetical protein ACLFS0_00385, partial [Bacteroidales bacterium]